MGQQSEGDDQLQPQGLLLRRQHGRIRNPQPAGYLLHGRFCRRARLLQLDPRTGHAQGVPPPDGLRVGHYLQRQQGQTIHDRGGLVGTGQGAQPRRMGRLLALPAGNPLKRLPHRALQLPPRQPPPARGRRLQPCSSAPVSTASGSIRPTWSMGSVRASTWRQATRRSW